MDTTWAIIGGAVIFWLGFRFGRAHTIVTMAREIAQEMSATTEREQTTFAIEKHQDQYFAYSEAHEFLGQGNSLVGLLQCLKDRYPGRTFRINREQLNFSQEETDQLIRAIFEVFGDHNKEEKRV